MGGEGRGEGGEREGGGGREGRGRGEGTSLYTVIESAPYFSVAQREGNRGTTSLPS